MARYKILIINNKRARSEYANAEPAVQALVDQLGGIHNVHLARLFSAKKILHLEGKDLAFLKTLHAKLYPNAETPLDAIPLVIIGGWGGWAHAIGSSMGLKNAVGESLQREGGDLLVAAGEQEDTYGPRDEVELLIPPGRFVRSLPLSTNQAAKQTVRSER